MQTDKLDHQTKLSVNINKIATLRNSRGGNNPNLITVALDCERYGAEGITVHPRPDERHIRYADVHELKKNIKTELNIEGRPDKRFLDLVISVKPAQCTLVPDPPDALTSNQGWDTQKESGLLREVVAGLKSQGIRVSVFVDPVLSMIEGAALCCADRIELYTESYALFYREFEVIQNSKNTFIQTPNSMDQLNPFIESANLATELGLGINAGHDLNLQNLAYFKKNIPHLLEVSIGHALISDALYLGLENTIQLYLRQLIVH
jgi:pyridoxine 5-phosphate synthase